jgi:hypothetical protein
VSIEYQRKQAKAMQKYLRERNQQVQAEKSQCAFTLPVLTKTVRFVEHPGSGWH